MNDKYKTLLQKIEEQYFLNQDIKITIQEYNCLLCFSGPEFRPIADKALLKNKVYGIYKNKKVRVE